MYIDFPEVDIKLEGMEKVKFPSMVRIKQIYDSNRIEDIPSHIKQEMEKTIQEKESYKDKRICITVGSRGIPGLSLIVHTIVDILRSYGSEVFIVPAMGSHGNANAQGQVEMLEGLGVTEETVGAPIVSCMEVVQIGALEDGTPVYCDKFAFESDGIVVLNKVKPHTDFRGKHESGLAKMMAIGLANHKGASMFHMMGFPSFAERIPQVCQVFLEKAPVAFGVGIVQNAYDEISELEIIAKEKFLEEDAKLLEIAKKKIANFKMDDIDLLIIDEIGKNISGNGHDPNVTGRSNSKGFEDIINIKKMFIRGITKETHHNACGINWADVTTRRVLRDIDFSAVWTNVATATMLNGGKIPVYVETDRDAIALCLRTCNGIDFDNPRIVHIKNTLSMQEIEVSTAFLEELKDREDIQIISDPYLLEFDDNGFLKSNLN